VLLLDAIMVYHHDENSLGLGMIVYLQILIAVAVIIQLLSEGIHIPEDVVREMVT
jgi:hypothetical protein